MSVHCDGCFVMLSISQQDEALTLSAPGVRKTFCRTPNHCADAIRPVLDAAELKLRAGHGRSRIARAAQSIDLTDRLTKRRR